jgi:hypothetical protein
LIDVRRVKEGTLEHELLQGSASSVPINITVKKRVALEGEELETYIRKKKEAEKLELSRKLEKAEAAYGT